MRLQNRDIDAAEITRKPDVAVPPEAIKIDVHRATTENRKELAATGPPPNPSAPSGNGTAPRRCRQIYVNKGDIGGPGRDRTDDLFHAMEARSQTAPQAH